MPFLLEYDDGTKLPCDTAALAWAAWTPGVRIWLSNPDTIDGDSQLDSGELKYRAEQEAKEAASSPPSEEET